MAASANQEGAGGQKAPSAANSNGIPVNSANSGGNSAAANNNRSNSASETAQALRHDTGINTNWTPEEQATLEELLSKYASDSIIMKYAKIATKLNDKMARDVALRCRWMTKKENGKRRKDDHSSRKNKDRKEKATDSSAKSSSQLTPRPNGPAYPQPMIPVDNDDGISYEAIGGVTGDLLKQNSQYLNQVSANFSTYQFHDNISLLSKARDNILSILNDMNDMPEIMKQMPPLPVKLNKELAKSIGLP